MSTAAPGSLRQQRAFMHLWRSRLLSGASSQMLMLAIGWRMYDLTGSAWDLGLVGLFQFVPALLLALPEATWLTSSIAARWCRPA